MTLALDIGVSRFEDSNDVLGLDEKDWSVLEASDFEATVELEKDTVSRLDQGLVRANGEDKSMAGNLLGVRGKEEAGGSDLGAGVEVHEGPGKGRMKTG